MSAIDRLTEKVALGDSPATYLSPEDAILCMSFEAADDLLALTARSPLDRSPKKNWVENAGGLPKDIEDLAVELTKKGKSVSHAIAIAVSQAKKYAATSKDPKVRAKWGKAVAQWEALKAKNAAKSAAKSAK